MKRSGLDNQHERKREKPKQEEREGKSKRRGEKARVRGG